VKKKRFKIVPASYLVLIKNGKILLLRRFNTGHFDGHYSLVSGHLDGKETFRECMVREAKEEANIEISPENMEIVHMMNRYAALNPPELRERVDVFVRPEKWKGKIKNMESEKCDDLNWFPLDDLPSNTIPYIRSVIDHIKKGNFYSEFGW
jgi:8-oxo-dGTP diphosphatase